MTWPIQHIYRGYVTHPPYESPDHERQNARYVALANTSEYHKHTLEADSQEALEALIDAHMHAEQLRAWAKDDGLTNEPDNNDWLDAPEPR